MKRRMLTGLLFLVMSLATGAAASHWFTPKPLAVWTADQLPKNFFLNPELSNSGRPLTQLAASKEGLFVVDGQELVHLKNLPDDCLLLGSRADGHYLLLNLNRENHYLFHRSLVHKQTSEPFKDFQLIRYDPKSHSWDEILSYGNFAWSNACFSEDLQTLALFGHAEDQPQILIYDLREEPKLRSTIPLEPIFGTPGPTILRWDAFNSALAPDGTRLAFVEPKTLNHNSPRVFVYDTTTGTLQHQFDVLQMLPLNARNALPANGLYVASLRWKNHADWLLFRLLLTIEAEGSSTAAKFKPVELAVSMFQPQPQMQILNNEPTLRWNQKRMLTETLNLESETFTLVDMVSGEETRVDIAEFASRYRQVASANLPSISASASYNAEQQRLYLQLSLKRKHYNHRWEEIAKLFGLKNSLIYQGELYLMDLGEAKPTLKTVSRALTRNEEQDTSEIHGDYRLRLIGITNVRVDRLELWPLVQRPMPWVEIISASLLVGGAGTWLLGRLSKRRRPTAEAMVHAP